MTVWHHDPIGYALGALVVALTLALVAGLLRTTLHRRLSRQDLWLSPGPPEPPTWWEQLREAARIECRTTKEPAHGTD